MCTFTLIRPPLLRLRLFCHPVAGAGGNRSCAGLTNRQTDRQTACPDPKYGGGGGQGSMEGGGWVMDMGRHTTHKDVGEGRIANYCLAGANLHNILDT